MRTPPDERLAWLQAVLGSEGWNRIMEPALAARLARIREQLELDPTARPGTDDKELRGEIRGLRFAIENWNHLQRQWHGEELPDTREPTGIGSPYERNPDDEHSS